MKPALPLLLVAAVANANTPADYGAVFPIAQQGDAAAWRVDATPEVYRWSQDELLRDVEIFNGEGKPVPMARVAAEGSAAAKQHHRSIPVFDLPADAALRGDLNLVVVRDDSGHLRRIDERWHRTTPPREWLIDATIFEHPIDRLTLNWPTSNSAVMRVSVEGSDDLQAWSFLGSGTVLALEHSGTRIERRDLTLRSTRVKYLRVRRLDDGAPVNDLAAVAHSTETSFEFPAREWRAAKLLQSTATQSGGTQLTYVLDAPVPFDSVRVEFDNDNGLAAFEFFGRWDPSGPWIPLANLTAFRLRPEGEVLMNDEEHFSARGRLRELRFDSRAPVSQPPRVTVGYVPARFVFLAEGAGPWTLAAGSLRARSATWPIGAALATLRAKLGADWQPPLAPLGPPAMSAGDDALHDPPPPMPWKQWVLWGVLVLGATIIAGFALSLLRKPTT